MRWPRSVAGPAVLTAVLGVSGGSARGAAPGSSSELSVVVDKPAIRKALPDDDLAVAVQMFREGVVSATTLEKLRKEEQPGPVEPGLNPFFLIGGHRDRVDGADGRDPAVVLAENLRRDAVVRVVDGERTVCSGVIVATDWVLSAAHCLREEPTAVEIGYAQQTRVQLSPAPAQCRVPAALRGFNGEPDPDDACRTSPGPTGWPCACLLPAELGAADSTNDFLLWRLSRPPTASEATPAQVAAPVDGWPPVIGSGGEGPSVRVAAYGATELKPGSSGCSGARGVAVDRLSAEFELRRDKWEPSLLTLSAAGSAAAPSDSGAPLFAGTDGPWGVEVVVGVQKASDCHGDQTAASVLVPEVSDWISATTGVLPSSPLPPTEP